jgi:hypothetical protein
MEYVVDDVSYTTYYHSVRHGKERTMDGWMGPVIRWAGGAAILGYGLDSFATHQDRIGAWVSVGVGGYLIVRALIRR